MLLLDSLEEKLPSRILVVVSEGTDLPQQAQGLILTWSQSMVNARRLPIAQDPGLAQLDDALCGGLIGAVILIIVICLI